MAADVIPMIEVHEYINELIGFLKRDTNILPWSEISVFEINSEGTQFRPNDEGVYAWFISPSAIFTPAEYQTRFDDLLHAGYRWINMSCYGILNTTLIIAIELPGKTLGAPYGKTSINFSGPRIDVKTGECIWNAEGFIIIK